MPADALLFLRRSQRHGWAGGYVLLISRQSRAHSKISNRTSWAYHPTTSAAQQPRLARHCIVPQKKNLPIFSWGIDHERDSLRQVLQAMCQQVA